MGPILRLESRSMKMQRNATHVEMTEVVGEGQKMVRTGEGREREWEREQSKVEASRTDTHFPPSLSIPECSHRGRGLPGEWRTIRTGIS